jgi:hypothetical protein
VEPKEADKLALRLVAVDRQTATATRTALRAWARTKNATPRTYAALAFADALARAEEQTKVARP